MNQTLFSDERSIDSRLIPMKVSFLGLIRSLRKDNDENEKDKTIHKEKPFEIDLVSIKYSTHS